MDFLHLTSVPIPDRSIEVVALRLDDEAETALASQAVLDRTERERASRFVFENDRRRFTVARILLRQLLADRLAIPPEIVTFIYSTHGKPELDGRLAESGLTFNLSHCEDVAVFAFTHKRKIGIDVERVRSLEDADEVATRFFSVAENYSYKALPLRDKPQGFFNCWTRKEAFVKAIGEGLSHPLDRFDVSLVPGSSAEILRIGETPGVACNWEMYSFDPYEGFVGAVVAQCGEKKCLMTAAA